MYVVVQFYRWFKLMLLSFVFDYGNVDNEFETKEIKFKPRIKLNHNMYLLLHTVSRVQWRNVLRWSSRNKIVLKTFLSRNCFFFLLTLKNLILWVVDNCYPGEKRERKFLLDLKLRKMLLQNYFIELAKSLSGVFYLTKISSPLPP